MPKRRREPPPVAPDFEFCVVGRPVSAQSKVRNRCAEWKEHVARAARSRWPTGQIPWSTTLRVAISEFGESLERSRRDRDNTAKPILDALQGIIYLNDAQILELEVDARDINGEYVVRYISPVVAAALTRGDEFVWVRVFLHLPAKGLSR